MEFGWTRVKIAQFTVSYAAAEERKLDTLFCCEHTSREGNMKPMERATAAST